MPAPWEKDAVVHDTPADAPPEATANTDAPWAADEQARGYGEYGSGGAEDQGQFHDPNDNGTEASRTADGRLLVDIHGDADPYEVAGTPDSTGAAAARGTMDTISFGGANRLFAGLEGIDSALHGESFTDTYDSRLKQFQDVMHADEAGHPVARITGQLLGGLVIPAGLEGVGLRAGTSALRMGATMREARAAAAVAVRNRMALMGGAGGATHGYLSSDDLGSADAAENAAVEGLAGAAGGVALGQAGAALEPGRDAARVARRALPLSDAQRAIAAADRQDIDLIPEDVGGPLVRRLSSAAVQAPLSASPIIRASQRMLGQAETARDRIAESVGQVLNPEAAGEAAIRGARSFIARTSQRGNMLYRAAETGGEGVRIAPTQALGVLNRNIRELAQTPGGSAALDQLQGLHDALSQGTFTVQGIRNMRTALRDQFTQAGLRGSDVERRVNQVVDAANNDVTAGLRSAGRPEAARAYELADRYWRNRLRTIDENLEPIIGKSGDASGEQVVQRLQAAMKGNNARFAGFINALPADEQSTVRGSLIGQMGRATAGTQNAGGDAFSLSTFLTNWTNIGEGAKRRLFGPEARASLNDLAIVADHARQAQGYANRSNTAGGLWGNIGALFGLGAISPNAAATSAIAQLVGGRLLASPRFARWLARAPRTSLGSAAYLDRLTRIARAEPAIANDVLQLQSRLSEVMANGASAPLAAQDKKDGAAVPPQQKPDDAAYHQWLQKYGIREDPTYDTRAAFQHGLTPDERGHLNDAYKLPTHPTFSDESIHNGEGGKAGGKWVQTGPAKTGMPEGQWAFKASDWNLRNMSKAQLKAYFDKVEPGNVIIFPDGEHYRGKEQ
jgi:hypothetical protein